MLDKPNFNELATQFLGEKGYASLPALLEQMFEAGQEFVRCGPAGDDIYDQGFYDGVAHASER